MKPWPTRGPIMRRSSQKAREAISSRNSLAASQRNLREGKEDLLQPGVGRLTQTGKGTQFGKRAHAHHAAAAEQHQAVAHARGIHQLVNRDEQRAAAPGDGAQERHDVAGLAKVQAVEGFVEQQQRLRSEQAETEQDALGLALGEGADTAAKKALQFKVACQRGAFAPRTPVERFEESQRPVNRLVGPGAYAVREIEKRLLAPAGGQ